MGNRTYDVVVVGSGHNGLTVAAYLAKAGKSVLILEKNDWYGGGVVTHDMLAPGFKFDTHSSLHNSVLANPIITKDELGLLSKYGLEYTIPEAMFSTVFDDGSSLITYRDIDRSCEEIAKFSAHDAEAYRRFAELGMSYVPMMTQGLFVPAPQQGMMFAMLDQSVEGQRMFRAMQMNKLDLAREWFENEKVMIHLLRFAMETQTGPEDGGTGFILFAMAGMLHTYGLGLPRGGSGALAQSLVRCVEDHGAELRNNAEVTKVFVSGGRATGVQLASGEVIDAKVAVIGQIHPWLIGNIVEGVDAGVVERARQTKMAKISLIYQHFALNEYPQYAAGPEVGKVVLASMVPSTMERFCRTVDNYKYGDVWADGSTDTILAARMHCQFDPTQAPENKCALSLYSFAPYHLRGGFERWKDYSAETAERMLAYYRQYVTNMTSDNIIANVFHSPVDLANDSPMFQDGDVNGVGEFMFQMGGHRPNPELSKLKIPGIDNLYLPGAAFNAGSVSCAGRATAIKACQELNIDFDKLVG